MDSATAFREDWNRWGRLNPFSEPDEWSRLGVELGLEVARRERAALAADERGRQLSAAFREAAGERLTHADTLTSHEQSALTFGAPGRLTAPCAPNPAMQRPWLPTWPRLGSRPFPDRERFPWIAEIERAFPDIRRELIGLLERGAAFRRAIFDGFNGKPWTARYFHLLGEPIQATHAACPRTSALLQRVPQNFMHTCFSCLPPDGALPPHVGPSNTSLVCHLGVLGCEGSALFAGTEVRHYLEGECLVLDDSYVHGARNMSDEPRYTLMFSFWHPDLTADERTRLLPLYQQLGALTGKGMGA